MFIVACMYKVLVIRLGVGVVKCLRIKKQMFPCTGCILDTAKALEKSYQMIILLLGNQCSFGVKGSEDALKLSMCQPVENDNRDFLQGIVRRETPKEPPTQPFFTMSFLQGLTCNSYTQNLIANSLTLSGM